MINVQNALEEEIADGRLSRNDIATTYAFGIRDCPGEINWPKVNRLIMERWSPAGLRYIKEHAWRKVRGDA